MTNEVINWRTTTLFVDDDTGEKISETIAKQDYIIIKKEKNVTTRKQTGYITFTYRCRKSRQLRLFEVNDEKEHSADNKQTN